MLEDKIIKFFKQDSDNVKPTNKSDKYFSSKEHKFLLCLDNVECLIEQNGENVRSFLTRLINSCKSLSVIVISVRPIGIMHGLTNE